MKVSTRGRYALRLMADLARQPASEPVLLADIARREAISSRYLEQLALRLKKAGLLRSRRGCRGGFLLARPPAEISLLEIFHASEGTTAVTPCVVNSSSCERSGTCTSREVWQGISRLLRDFLGRQTLAELAATARAGREPAVRDGTPLEL